MLLRTLSRKFCGSNIAHLVFANRVTDHSIMSIMKTRISMSQFLYFQFMGIMMIRLEKERNIILPWTCFKLQDW